MLLSAVAAPMRAAARPLRAATASTRRLSSSSVKALHPDSLVTRLVWTVEDTVDERPLAAAVSSQGNTSMTWAGVFGGCRGSEVVVAFE